MLESNNVHLYIPRASLTELKALGALAKDAIELASTCHVIEPLEDAAPAAPAADGVEGATADEGTVLGSAAAVAAAPGLELFAIARRCRARAGAGVVVASVPATHSTPLVRKGRRLGADDLPAAVMVATQDLKVRQRLRKLPGLPVLFLNRNVVVLDSPSEASKGVASKVSAREGGLSATDRAVMASVMGTGGASAASGAAGAKPKKKRRGPKGPNPLSCKPKRAAKRGRDGGGPVGEAAAAGGKTRRGKRGKGAAAATE